MDNNFLSDYMRNQGKKGGKARGKKLSSKRLQEIAQMGVKARLNKTSHEQRSAIARKAALARHQKNKNI